MSMDEVISDGEGEVHSQRLPISITHQEPSNSSPSTSSSLSTANVNQGGSGQDGEYLSSDGMRDSRGRRLSSMEVNFSSDWFNQSTDLEMMASLDDTPPEGVTIHWSAPLSSSEVVVPGTPSAQQRRPWEALEGDGDDALLRSSMSSTGSVAESKSVPLSEEKEEEERNEGGDLKEGARGGRTELLESGRHGTLVEEGSEDDSIMCEDDEVEWQDLANYGRLLAAQAEGSGAQNGELADLLKTHEKEEQEAKEDELNEVRDSRVDATEVSPPSCHGEDVVIGMDATRGGKEKKEKEKEKEKAKMKGAMPALFDLNQPDESLSYEDTAVGGFRESLADAARGIVREMEKERERDREGIISDTDNRGEELSRWQGGRSPVGRISMDCERPFPGIHLYRADSSRALFDTGRSEDTGLMSSLDCSRARCPTRNDLQSSWRWLKRRKNMFLYLTILGLCVGTLSVFLELLVAMLFEVRSTVLKYAEHWMKQWGLYIAWSICATLLSVLATKIDSNAIGSGIPEMKSILTGITLSQYLSLRVMIAKFFGLLFAIVGGLFIGNEGPLVHMASIIANNLLRLKIFKRLRVNAALTHQLFSAAVTAGVAASFGSPVGGLLFSIEVSSTYWPTRRFVCSQIP